MNTAMPSTSSANSAIILTVGPETFGADKSQAMIGVQMAFAYIGFLVMPPLFGVIAEKISIALLPVYQLLILACLFAMHETLIKKTKRSAG